MALAGLTALTAACASGGGALPLTGAEAEVLVAGITGVWELDKSSSEMPEWNIRSVGTPIPGENVEQARQEAVRMSEATMAVLEPILSVAQPWTTLSLRVDEERLVFVSTPGGSLEVPMSGEWIDWTEQVLGRHPIRTRVYRDGDNLALEHRPRAGGQVRSVLEVTDGRLQITIRVRALRRSLAPWVLVYERNEAGGR